MIERVPDLWKTSAGGEMLLQFDPRPVMGVMAPFVGHQYTAEEIWQFRLRYAEIHREEEQQMFPLSARIRAFDIPSLRGARITVTRLDGFPAVLHDLLWSCLPGWEWEEPRCRFGPIKKYGMLHTLLIAPTDATTQQPMVLELFGRVSTLNGQPVGRQWFESFRHIDQAHQESVTLGKVGFLLERATYANTRSPGIGVPFSL